MVCNLNRLVKGCERNQGSDRAEDFFLSDAHSRVNIGKNRGRVEPAMGKAARFDTMSSYNELGALVLPDLNVLHDRLQLRFVDHRSDIGFGIKSVADFEGPYALRKSVEKFSVNFIMNGDAAGGCATLPARAEPAPDRAFHGEIEVRIVHDD